MVEQWAAHAAADKVQLAVFPEAFVGVYDTPLGRLGAVICWEDLMTTARIAMYDQGIELYCAPTADGREGQGRNPVLAVEPATAPTLHHALTTGHPVDVEVGGVAVDSLGARQAGSTAVRGGPTN